MHRIPVVVSVACLLGACSSMERPVDRPSALAERSGGSLAISSRPIEMSRRPVDESEDYKGPQIAAVAPVSDKRPRHGPSDDGLRADIQRSIQRQLDASGIFAGVVTLDQPDEENEAEVIIEPALQEPARYGGDPVTLRVRVTEKTKRRVVLDERYEGDNRASSLKVAISDLEENLEHRYAR
jgi:hypothetical protein